MFDFKCLLFFAAKSLQSCSILCDPIDSRDSPGKNTGVGCHFLLQCMKVKSESEVLSRVRPSATPWTAAFQAPPSMGFSRQEYWSGVPLPSPLLFFRPIKLEFIYNFNNIIRKKTYIETYINPDRQTDRRDLIVFCLRFKISLQPPFFLCLTF